MYQQLFQFFTQKSAITSVPQLSKLQCKGKAERVYLSFRGEWSNMNVTIYLAFGLATVRLPSNFEKSTFSFVRQSALWPIPYSLAVTGCSAQKLHFRHHTQLGFFHKSSGDYRRRKGFLHWKYFAQRCPNLSLPFPQNYSFNFLA